MITSARAEQFSMERMQLATFPTQNSVAMAERSSVLYVDKRHHVRHLAEIAEKKLKE